jgi:hypothetical protein
MTSADDLTSAELALITGKPKPAQQAAELAKRGVPFVFSGRAVRVSRIVAQAHELVAERRPAGGIDFDAVRR